MNPIRAAAQERIACIPGAFLRCDRGRTLYITNAALRSKERIDWQAAGFDELTVNGLTFLSPRIEILDAFVRWARMRAGQAVLSAAVKNACFQEILPEDMMIWTEGIKRLEMRRDAAVYEKMVRQWAAVCLRKKRGGGTLQACALIVDIMNGGGTENED